jgi:hypothetical protein
MSAGRPEIHTHTSRTARKRDKTTKQKMNDTDKTKAAHTGVHNSFFSASSLVNMRAIENKNGKKKSITNRKKGAHAMKMRRNRKEMKAPQKTDNESTSVKTNKDKQSKKQRGKREVE